jgi:hypothetical protein
MRSLMSWRQIAFPRSVRFACGFTSASLGRSGFVTTSRPELTDSQEVSLR